MKKETYQRPAMKSKAINTENSLAGLTASAVTPPGLSNSAKAAPDNEANASVWDNEPATDAQ